MPRFGKRSFSLCRAGRVAVLLISALGFEALPETANTATLTYSYTGVWDIVAYDFVAKQFFTGASVSGFVTIDTSSPSSGCSFTCYAPLGAITMTTHGSTYVTGADNLRVSLSHGGVGTDQ
jgi:hypothetical protein